MWNPFLIGRKRIIEILNEAHKRYGRKAYIYLLFKRIARNKRLTNYAFKLGLCAAYWINGAYQGQDAKKYFKRFKRPFLWCKEQRKAFAELPANITLYRGVGMDEVVEAGWGDDGVTITHPSKFAISWTPRIEQARKFAQSPYKIGRILQTTINKERIKTFYWYGDNQECVVVLDDADKVIILDEVFPMSFM